MSPVLCIRKREGEGKIEEKKMDGKGEERGRKNG